MSPLLSFVVASLYYLCFAFLLALIGLITAAPKTVARRTTTTKLPWVPTRSVRVRRNGQVVRSLFFCIALSLFLWQLTLYWEARTALPTLQIWLGRINFASVALVVFLARRFVGEVAASAYPPSLFTAPSRFSCIVSWTLYGETVALALITLGTPLVDKAEWVVDGHPSTEFGPLFPLYLLHVVGYLAAALFTAFWMRCRITTPSVRGQLAVVGIGMLSTGSISLITNAYLPYIHGDFRFCDVGTLSTLFFVLAVDYAVFVHGLFDVRLVVRATLIYGLLLALVLGAYSSVVFLTAQYLTGGAGTDPLTQFVVLFIAFSFDPIRRFLEDTTDNLLFGIRRTPPNRRSRRTLPSSNRTE